LYRGGCSVKGFQSKLELKLAWLDFVLPLLTGGRYSEVAVNTDLTVHTLIQFFQMVSGQHGQYSVLAA
jgi:hypothetical protein